MRLLIFPKTYNRKQVNKNKLYSLMHIPVEQDRLIEEEKSAHIFKQKVFEGVTNKVTTIKNE